MTKFFLIISIVLAAAYSQASGPNCNVQLTGNLRPREANEDELDFALRISTAIEALGKSSDPVAPLQLMSAAQSENFELKYRTDSVLYLGLMKYEPALPYLRGLVEALLAASNKQPSGQDAVGEMGYVAIRALGFAGDTDSIDLLLRVFNESSFEDQRVAAYALAEIGDERVVPVLAERALSDKKDASFYRRDIIEALGKIKCKASAVAIATALSKYKSDPNIVYVSAFALANQVRE